MNFFTSECLDLHNDSEQLERQMRISNLDIVKKNKNELVAVVFDRENNEKYITSLENCSCDDFTERQLPCRHMYGTANAFELFKVSKNVRLDKLIADFSKGYADGWKFIVRPCNYDALDIKWMQRKKNKKSYSMLTQGEFYNFIPGTLFYDNIAAYKEKWEYALKKINYIIQVLKVTPTDLDYEVVLKDDILTRITIIDYGEVVFKLYGFGNKELGEYSCKQNEFLELLRDGMLKDKNNNKIDLYKHERNVI